MSSSASCAVLLLVAALFVVAIPAMTASSGSGSSDCSMYNGQCDSCSQLAGCGYCLSSDVCEQGNATGSWSGDCGGSSWAWYAAQCNATPATTTPAPPSDICAPFDGDCLECTTQLQCGYCASTNLCEQGNNSGSLNGDCSGVNWIYFANECGATPPPSTPAPTPVPTIDCSLYKDCIGCTAQTGCGFCSSTNVCETGNAAGGWDGCSGSNWSWFPSTCSNQ